MAPPGLWPDGPRIVQYLAGCGFAVETADARDLTLRAMAFDLIVLSAREALGGSGGPLLTARAAPPVVAMFHPGEEDLGLEAIEAGAADAVALAARRELLARVRAILRRNRPALRAPVSAYEFEGARFDLALAGLVGPMDRRVPLSTKEVLMLRAFLERPGAVLSRQELIDLCMGHEADVYDRAVDCLVSRLRRKLVSVLGHDPIQTRRAAGYSFAPQVRPVRGPVEAAPRGMPEVRTRADAHP
ncbi:response regulator transcription factor [Phenylobacterium sp.]|uniref:winged helix-turn-helix transcriptional regulator n=1 Tax=Phenylobacterium sp. TaxID=1871053 RepID=UPI002B756EEA|nr:response regulator transcription factor [Phenylobacterium sp.]HVI31467.1 response regulator transcription factor [Phenylobacterium sp.]